MINMPSNMLELKVDLGDFIVEAEKEMEASIKTLVRKAGQEAYDFWYEEAGRRLQSSRSMYQDAITLTYLDDTSFIVSVEGTFAAAVERGSPPFPMKFDPSKNIPLNTQRDVYFRKAPKFRKQGNKTWTHPGFVGVHIAESVEDELADRIVPNLLQAVLKM